MVVLYTRFSLSVVCPENGAGSGEVHHSRYGYRHRQRAAIAAATPGYEEK